MATMTPEQLAERLVHLQNLAALRAAEADLAEQEARIRAAQQYMRPPLPTEPATPEKVCPWFGSKCKFGTKCRHTKKPKPAAGAGVSDTPTSKPEKAKKKCQKKTPPAVPAAASGSSSGQPKRRTKAQTPCRFFNPETGDGCDRGPSCAYLHLRK